MPELTNPVHKIVLKQLFLNAKAFGHINTIFLRALVGIGSLWMFLALAACGPATERAGVPSDRTEIEVSEIKQFIETYDTAWLNKDIARLSELMDSSYVYFSSRGSVFGSQYVLDLVGHPTYRVEDMSRTEIIPHIHGSIAVVGTRWTATPYYKGQRYDDDQRCVLVISKQSGSLQLLSEHCTEITE